MLHVNMVRDWMTSPVITIPPSTPVREAHQLMQERNIRRLPVVKNDKLVGIITLGDLREALPSDATSLSIWEENYLLDKLLVEKVMTREVLTVKPETTIIEAAQLMLDRKISGLPVLGRKDALVGVLTESDIFRMVIRQSLEQIQAEQAV